LTKPTLSRWYSTPRATIVFFAAGLVFLVVIVSVMLASSYRNAEERAETRASAYSQVVAANIQWLMEATHQALERIDLAVGDSLSNPSPNAMEDLALAVGRLPAGVQGWVFDATGAPRLTNADTTQRVNASDREYFAAAKAGAPFFISSLLTSRSSNEPVFVVAKRIERAGRFVGVGIIAIPAGYMDGFRNSLEIGAASTVGLIRDDGMLVSRSPVPAEATDMSQYILFTDYLKASDEGTYSSHSPTDGVERIVGYRRVAGYPLVAVASIAMDEAFQDFWNTVIILSAIVVPGTLVMALFAFRSLRAQVGLSAALERNQTLFREIHHRVKNNLQQISALVQLQPLEPEVKTDMARRINAMVAVHEHMYRSDQYDTVNAADYLPALIEGVRSSFANPVPVETAISPAILDRDQALPLALICNEVIANAIKHAFPGNREGRISVVLEERETDVAMLTIRDNGVGYDASAKTTGMGTRLVRGLISQLGGSAKVEIDGGTVFTLSFTVAGFER